MLNRAQISEFRNLFPLTPTCHMFIPSKTLLKKVPKLSECVQPPIVCTDEQAA